MVDGDNEFPESIATRPRRPWLAAFLSLTGNPIGQIYAGRFRRAVILWIIFGILLPFVVFSILLFLPAGRTVLGILALCSVSFPLYIMFDAYLAARRHRYDPPNSIQRWWVYLLAFIGFIIGANIISMTIRTYLAESFVVPTSSMSPTILPGDRFMSDKLWCQPHHLKRNDILVFRSDGPNSPLYVHRLIGLPGDTVEIANQKIFLNGQAWDDPHAHIDPTAPLLPELENHGPVTVPPNSFFALGDNRRNSFDSRISGPISFEDVVAKARIIYWSQERKFLRPYSSSVYKTGPVLWSRIGKRLD